ncbi:sterol desaturase [Pseudomonas taiwanensis]|uniref:SRPBCC family protein n=1 Tax=Pseudomonas taiwanensis TaxID=470150 RepID=UPI0015B997DC|nr:SRPBCC family protein [Pseudomonas taiwanensis]NWL81067.1 sterol desaturase [Pseudomonas taiwanensis]
MSHDTQAFRDRYRAGIHPLYNVWLHGGFVLLYGATCLTFFISSLSDVKTWEWLVVPAALVFFNWGEYSIHKNLGHHKTRAGSMFYKRHTGDHHSFFVAGKMTWESARDWRVILFPAWLIVFYSVGLFAAWWLLSLVNSNVAALFSTTLLAGYLSYEVFHACEHLPANHPISRLPWISHMRRLHELHHRRDLMQTHNFNLVFPLMDWLKGSLHWEPLEQENAMTRMQHAVEIDRSPERVLAYASTATRWPEWHPSSLRVDGPAGPLPAGSHFEEDIHAGGRAGHLSWDVTEYSPGHLWRATARGTHGLELVLTYECESTGNGTRFIRTLEYGFSGLAMQIANWLVMRNKIDRESVESMKQLKEMAERAIEKPGTRQHDLA